MKTLNPKLWNDKNLKASIRRALLKIAYKFANEHYLPKEIIKDITITGSLANYNWNKFSDVDLHIIIDFEDVDGEDELINDYYKTIKSAWNDTHDIEVCGHEVEIYVQDEKEIHSSTGVYSLLNGEWVLQPTQTARPKINKNAVNRKTQRLAKQINQLKEKKNDSAYVQEKAQQIKDKISKMRKQGLGEDGEYSIGNLVFKKLRNQGLLDVLSNLKVKAHDDALSVKDCSFESKITKLLN